MFLLSTYSEAGLGLDSTKLLVDSLIERGDAVGVDVTIVEVANGALCVVLVLDLHAGEAAHIDVVTEVLAGCHPLGSHHVHVEGCVRLRLAVADALTLLSALNRGELGRHAVLVALAEEKSRQGVGLQ